MIMKMDEAAIISVDLRNRSTNIYVLKSSVLPSLAPKLLEKLAYLALIETHGTSIS